ncbi:hypothetical protein ACJX0J_015726, partial [Zea mays]
MASEKSKILVVGGTGYLGRHVVAASARLGHPTSALVRDTAPSDPAKAALLKTFQDAGVTLLKGDLYDQASLVSAVKGADVVISVLGSMQIADQSRLVDAIKEAGNVKVGAVVSCLSSSLFFFCCKSATASRHHVSASFLSWRVHAEVLPVGVRPGRGPHGHRGAGQVHPRRQGGHPPRHRGRGHTLHLRRGRLLRGLRAPQHRAAPRPRPARGQGGRPRRRRHQGGVRGGGRHRHVHGAGGRRPARGEQGAVHQAAGQHAVAQRAAVAVGEEDRQDVPAGVRAGGSRAQADPRVAVPSEHHPGDRARGVRAWGADGLRDRPGQGGGRQRTVPGCQVHHRRRVPQPLPL